MTVSRMLVVRGIRTTNELQQLGLPMARRYAESDIVVLVGDDGRGLVVKGSKTTTLVAYLDADSSSGRCMRAVSRVREAYMASSLPVVGWGDETVVGMFLYYWPIDTGSVDVVADAVERGDGAAVEAAADAFIASDFGVSLGSPVTIPQDGHGDDAPGHAATRTDGSTGSLHRTGE